jgi:hypothetical protein
MKLNNSLLSQGFDQFLDEFFYFQNSREIRTEHVLTKVNNKKALANHGVPYSRYSPS